MVLPVLFLATVALSVVTLLVAAVIAAARMCATRRSQPSREADMELGSRPDLARESFDTTCSGKTVVVS